MSTILVIAEHDGGVFKKTAAELLGKATELAGATGGTVCALVLGDAPAADLGQFGASKAYHVAGDFSDYDTAKVVAGICGGIEASGATTVLAAAGFLGKDAIPRVVARMNGGQSSECTELRVDGGQIVGRRPMYAGKAFVDTTITRAPAVFTVRPNSFGQPAGGGGAAEVEAVNVDLPAAQLTLVERKAPQTAAGDWTEAERSGPGGRALKRSRIHISEPKRPD